MWINVIWNCRKTEVTASGARKIREHQQQFFGWDFMIGVIDIAKLKIKFVK